MPPTLITILSVLPAGSRLSFCGPYVKTSRSAAALTLTITAVSTTITTASTTNTAADVPIHAASTTITTASTTITVADVPIPAATTAAALTLTAAPSRRTKGVVIRDPEESTTTSIIIHSEAKSKDEGKGIMIKEPKPLKKQAQIEQDEKYARKLEAELNRTIDWDEVIDHINKKAKEDKFVKRYQALKRKPQTEAQARKNRMVYLKNVAGFKMDYFKGMSYDDIRLIFEKHFDSNVAFLQKTKEQVDEEDSKALKRLKESKEEKAAKKQKLDEEVEELKRHLQIMPNEDDDVYPEATPLARKVPDVDYEIYNENNKPYFKIKRADERRYPLTRFTLSQMLNNVRLKVEEENEVSLELLSSEVKELKRHLQIVPNEDDDVYTEATLLARKVPVVDYEIYNENNKPYFKIKRADDTHQLYVSFLSMLRNFDREDLEVLWQLVKERFATTKPKNISNDFLLITLGAVFQKPDIHAQIWKTQRSVHGQAKVKSWKLLESCGVQIITFTTTQLILLVERRYPLTRFTLSQMLNNAPLEVEEESEVSLELLRFIRQQHQEGAQLE
uniref:Uncharacterized protein n=1 Tax=Tanacetum cinerariifolium TaxID=118510 RepID=A0A6L2KAQ3_TANCI|nr:hypothetical protein [Tanacetum cinerariifolium]